ncbi:MAG: class II fumarate hydratase [Desulfocapsaceae bacterium]|jgi:fumarate hydratase class II|nr:class II fumarate hydratase [Desulfocapsaceae bacterium]
MAINYRIEQDSMGQVRVPSQAFYGAQTQRALNNFTISNEPMPEPFIRAVLTIKIAAAITNGRLKLLDSKKAEAIVDSGSWLLDNGLDNHFPVPVLQTGSGTSTNMNVNEVLSFLAAKRGVTVSANDDVNMGQSSNDVIPSALNIAAAVMIKNRTIGSLQSLALIIREKARKYQSVIKTGRTHLMDALPIRLSHELDSWAAMIDDCIARLEETISRLVQLPLGGTAVGSGVNCHPDFSERALAELSRIHGLQFRQMASKFKGISSIDTPLEASGALKTAACCLMKIANDLRWMNSGPGAGLHEITLPPLQPGSSIMPDKINPIIPEAVCMAAAQVIGNDTTITVAAQSGNFQLNTMLPITAARLIESCELIGGAAENLGNKAIKDMQVHRQAMESPLHKNPVLVTALTTHIGYLQAAAIAKKARQEGKTILAAAAEETSIAYERLVKLLDPEHVADGNAAS